MSALEDLCAVNATLLPVVEDWEAEELPKNVDEDKYIKVPWGLTVWTSSWALKAASESMQSTHLRAFAQAHCVL